MHASRRQFHLERSTQSYAKSTSKKYYLYMFNTLIEIIICSSILSFYNNKNSNERLKYFYVIP